ncbi:hypothetical protein BQ8420_23855 [Nocardiopsis sp. JB363]|nr:hypothetical protein BQ8420_23855 [Nocardiopsis sp. JB363]
MDPDTDGLYLEDPAAPRARGEGMGPLASSRTTSRALR